MKTELYTGVNIQWPISDLILDRSKTIETRTYQLPQKYLNIPMVFIETPGSKGKFKARIRGLITFGECFKYSSARAFYKDVDLHRVEKGSLWAWDLDKPKWGWVIKELKVFKEPVAAPLRKGIVYTKDIELNLALVECL